MRNSSSFPGGTITVHGVAGSQKPPTRRLRDNSALHLTDTGQARSTVWGLPSVLQSGFYYVPSNLEDVAYEGDNHITLSTCSDVEVYVLWPALQEPPSWLLHRFMQFRGTQVKVSWLFSLKQRAVLNLTNRRKAFEQQTLQVWRLRAAVHATTTISLPGLGCHSSSGLPGYPYIFCVKSSATAEAPAADKSNVPLVSMTTSLLTCSMLQLRAMFEDGTINCAGLPNNLANALLRRCLQEEEPELLLVMLELGLGAQADQDALQQVVTFAVANHELQLLQEALASGAAELHKQDLIWWVRELVGGPNLFDAERLLADYCLPRRNPLSAMSAVEAVLLNNLAVANNRSGAAQLAHKFGATKRVLLQHLQDRRTQQLTAAALMDMPTASGSDVESGVSPLAQPAGLQDIINHCMEVKVGSEDCSIHELSPFRKAVRIHDTELLHQAPIRSFAKQLWVGLELQQLHEGLQATRLHRSLTRHPTAVEPSAMSFRPGLAQQDVQAHKHWVEGAASNLAADASGPAAAGSKADHASADGKMVYQQVGPLLRDPKVGYELLQNIGLTTDASWSKAAALACKLLHLVIVTPRSFFHSPRGQWLMHCGLELVFLATFQCLVFRAFVPGLQVLFMVLVAGNLVQVVHHITILHVGSVRKYFSSNLAKLDVLVYLGLAAVAVGWVVIGLDEQGWTWDLAAGLAVPVWARALGVLVPANARLGALLYTLGRMVEEASSMGLIILVLLLGFSTALYAIYHNLMSSYSSFAGAFRMFMGVLASDTHLLDFEEAGNGNMYYTWFGQGMVMLFIVVVNILLMTLLIAVINHTYHPEGIAKQTTVMFATVTDSYMLQVQEGLAFPPINILQLLLSWLPRRYRHRVGHEPCLQRWLLPVDGYSSTLGPSRSTGLMPTGPAELAYVLFLLTLFPVMGLVAVGLLVLYLPIGVVYFVSHGHKQWLGREDNHLGRGRIRRQTTRRSRASDDFDGDAASRHSIDMPGNQLLPGGIAHHRGAPRTGSSSLRPQRRRSLSLRAVPVLLSRSLRTVCTWVAAAVVALVVQLVLVLGVLAVLGYSLVCQLVWALWCTFFWWLLPEDMVEEELVVPRRSADYWSPSEVLAAYEACKVLSSKGMMRMSGTVHHSMASRAAPRGSWAIGAERSPGVALHSQHSSHRWTSHSLSSNDGATWGAAHPPASRTQSDAALGPDSEVSLVPQPPSAGPSRALATTAAPSPNVTRRVMVAAGHLVQDAVPAVADSSSSVIPGAYLSSDVLQL